MSLNDKLYLPSKYLKMYEKNIEIFSESNFKQFISSIKKDKEIKSGKFSNVYLSGDNAIKEFVITPFYENDGLLISSNEDVVSNLVFFLDKDNNDISFPNKLYAVDSSNGIYIAGYNSNRINCDTFSSLMYRDIYLDDFFESWYKALDIAKYFILQQRVMYDLNHSNCFITNKNFKVCDLDFYNSDSNIYFVSMMNYYLVNKLFTEFIEHYLINFRFISKKDFGLLSKENYIDSAIRELNIKFGNCKTLSEMG